MRRSSASRKMAKPKPARIGPENPKVELANASARVRALARCIVSEIFGDRCRAPALCVYFKCLVRACRRSCVATAIAAESVVKVVCDDGVALLEETQPAAGDGHYSRRVTETEMQVGEVRPRNRINSLEDRIRLTPSSPRSRPRLRETAFPDPAPPDVPGYGRAGFPGSAAAARRCPGIFSLPPSAAGAS
jgi:hypothetical protein